MLSVVCLRSCAVCGWDLGRYRTKRRSSPRCPSHVYDVSRQVVCQRVACLRRGYAYHPADHVLGLHTACRSPVYFGAERCARVDDQILGDEEAAALDEGEAATQAFTEDQQALVDLAQQARRSGLMPEDAGTMQEWSDEYGLNFRGPEIHPNRNFDIFHVHIGPVSHIPTSIGPVQP